MISIARSGALAGALAATVLAATAGSDRRSFQDHDIVIDKELLITAAEVVDSPLAGYPGPWSFGHLMEEAFGKADAPKVVANWLAEWAVGKTAEKEEEEDLPPRPRLADLVIEPWKQRDGYDEVNAGRPWRPDLANAPFRLLAIVNRMDLSVAPKTFEEVPSNAIPLLSSYSAGSKFDSSGGEARLVFGVVDEDGKPLEGGATLIFEYGLGTAGKSETYFGWARAWHSLGRHKEFDAGYRTELARVTRSFTGPVEVPKSASGRSTINPQTCLPFRPTRLMRIRTHEKAFGETREFREYKWSENDGLVAAPMKGMPREVFFEKGTRENRWLARWLRDRRGGDAVAVSTLRPTSEGLPSAIAVPTSATINGEMQTVSAMVATIPNDDPNYHWNGWALNDSNIRRTFSMQTCVGCHAGDTGTAFFHITPRERGAAAGLSKYLRTDGTRLRVRDPETKRGVSSSEMDDRKELFEAVLNPQLTGRKIQAIKDSRAGRIH